MLWSTVFSGKGLKQCFLASGELKFTTLSRKYHTLLDYVINNLNLPSFEHPGVFWTENVEVHVTTLSPNCTRSRLSHDKVTSAPCFTGNRFALMLIQFPGSSEQISGIRKDVKLLLFMN